METAMLGWILAAFFFGVIAGAAFIYTMFVADRKPPVLRPYQAPTLGEWARADSNYEPEALRERAQAEELIVSKAEVDDLIQQIMRETGVDEAQARDEVDLILAEANAIGQG